MKRRFEFQKGNNCKFWEAELVETSITVVCGLVGFPGHTHTREFATKAQAQREYEKLVSDKKRIGYVEHTADSSSNETASRASEAFPLVLNSIKNWLQQNDAAFHICPAMLTDPQDLARISGRFRDLPEQFLQLYREFSGLARTYHWCDCASEDDADRTVVDTDADDEQLEDPDELFDGFFFMSIHGVDGVISDHETFQDMEFDGGPAHGPVKRMCYNERWVPFAKDYGGNFVGIDLDPPGKGNFGQVIKFGRDETPAVLARDLQSFFLNYCHQHNIDLPSTSMVIVSKKSSGGRKKPGAPAQEVQVKFTKVAGVAKSVLRQPECLESGLSYLFDIITTGETTNVIAAMEEIGTIGEGTRSLLSSFSRSRADHIRQLLDHCAKEAQQLLKRGDNDVTEESVRMLTALAYEEAIDDIIACLSNNAIVLETIWCVGKFREAARKAAPKLLQIIADRYAEMSTYGPLFLIVEAALLALESIGYMPVPSDNVLGDLVSNKDASIAATTCRLLARSPSLAAMHVDAIRLHLADKRGRLSSSADAALRAAQSVSQ